MDKYFSDNNLLTTIVQCVNRFAVYGTRAQADIVYISYCYY